MARRKQHSGEDADTELDVAPLVDLDAPMPRRRPGRETDRFDRGGLPIAPVRLPNERGASADRPEVGARYLNYTIRRRLARGSMGLVYEAEHLHLGRRVAIKFLNPRLLSNQQSVLRFLGEARAMAQITHPGITAVHDFGQDRAGNAYLVMEHLDGDSLADRLETGALELRHALEIGAQIADALGAAHANGIVHRDLKPDNIFVLDGPPMQIKLVDFGVARPSDDSDRAGLRTATGCLVGTPAYMAPEQTYSLGVTAETDIYALGCVLFQVIGGRPVFDGSVADVIDAHRHKRAPALAAAIGLPRSLSALVAQMLDKQPSQRPSSGDEVAARLRGIAADLGLRWADPSATTDRLERDRVERAVSAQRPRLPRRSEPRAALPPPPRAAPPLAFAPTLAAEITPLPFHDNSALGTPEPFHSLGGPEVASRPRRPNPQRRLWVFVALASALGLGAWLVATML